MSEETPGLGLYDRYNGSDVLIHQRFAPQVTLIERTVYPIWAAFGIPGGLFSVYLWSGRPMRRGGSAAAATYQACLGVVDLSYLSVQIIWYLHAAWQQKVLDYPVVCEVFPTIFYLVQYLGPVINMTFTIERFLAICYPFRSQHCLIRSSGRGALKIIGILTTFCLCTASVQSMVFVYKDPTCNTRDELNMEGHIAKWLHQNWTFVTELFFFVFLPTLCLVLNICVVRVLHQKSSVKRKSFSVSYRNGTQSANSESPYAFNSDSKQHISRNIRASTITLVCTSFYMIIANYSVAVALLIALLLPLGDPMLSDEEIDRDPVWNLYFRLFTIRISIDYFAMSQFVIKFPIYLVTSKQFRGEFLKLFQCLKKTQPMMHGRLSSVRQTLTPSVSGTSRFTLNGDQASPGMLPISFKKARHDRQMSQLGPISLRQRPSAGMTRLVIGASGERVPAISY
ncbi:hypothetical protein CRM22_006619 [Opisthorchis felineus]|uniref:G-protein coupled receptors family 1 profile domain-containing protein n=1 Tax=Opisthorchis felineus TaxID=147828 RepID=A0A4S2LJZ7_OPIFE|nr:hypothetical protein CRM22_006619 [Opisthorchis felineus]